MGQPAVRHSDYVAQPAELAMEEHGFDCWSSSPRSNFIIYKDDDNVYYSDDYNDDHKEIRMEVTSSRPDYLPTLSAAKTSKLSLLVKHHILAIDEAN